MRIAVDAMGGDYAPGEIVAGAVNAAANLPSLSKVLLVGDETAVRRELSCAGSFPSDKIEVCHASQVVEMGEAAALGVRRKKDSSIGRAVDLVKEGAAEAVVSAGNTGAVVVAATLKLGVLPGVQRPAIAAVIPSQRGPVVLIDAGANIDCDGSLLTQFAVMGSIYSKAILKRPKPVVGLLSIGGEDIKGNEITKEAFRILSGSRLNFRGNVEGHDVYKGETDVVVCDGFVGNIVLKTSESVAHAISHWLKQEFKANLIRRLGALMLTGAIRTLKERTNPELYGGAPLLGVNGVVIIAHGSSSACAIFHAIRVACEAVEQRVTRLIETEISVFALKAAT